MSKTKIEWCDITINPAVGCSKCSPGCDNCYAEKMAYRLSKMSATAAKYAGVLDENGWTGKINFDLSVFDKLPKKPQRIFVGSMGDLFHPNLDDNNGEGMRELLNILRIHPQHTFMMLTKRPKQMRSDIEWLVDQDDALPDNLWLGVTVCNQQEVEEKIPTLLYTPSAKRFVSVEPMLGPIELEEHFLNAHCMVCKSTDRAVTGCKSSTEGHFSCNGGCDITAYPWKTHWISGLDWVICGGETGHGARPMHPDWVRNLRDQCQEAGVPFFFKQMSGKKPIPEDLMIREFPRC